MTERLEFNEYFLKARLKRVPMTILKTLLLELLEPKQKDELEKYSQSKLIEEIFFYYKLREKNKNFINIFNNFMRDHLFSAKESVYLIQIPNQNAVIDWIKLWKNGNYIGERYNFSKHTHVSLEERFLSIEETGGEKVFFLLT